MYRPQVPFYEDAAVDVVVNVLNAAKSKIGLRQNLSQLAKSRNQFARRTNVSVQTLRSPLVVSCERFIEETIAKTWKLADTFKFFVRYVGSSTDETAGYLYYEAVFSQPTPAYPVPQATVSVFFKIKEKHLEPTEVGGLPEMTFRIEGQHANHDVRSVLLTAERLLAVVQMKVKLYRRIEAFNLF